MVNAQLRWWACQEVVVVLKRVTGVEAGLEDYMGVGEQSVVEIGRVTKDSGHECRERGCQCLDVGAWG